MADDELQAEFQDLVKIVEECTNRQVAEMQELGEGFGKVSMEIAQLAAEIEARITDCNKRIADIRASGPQPAEAVEHTGLMGQIQTENDATLNNILKIQSGLEKSKLDIEELELEKVDLERRRQEIENEAAGELPRTKMKLQVYHLVSGIKWDFDVTDRVKGEINAKGSHDSKEFDFEPASESQWSIADKLWDLV